MASGEFLGTFENAVNKQRVIIPAPFKKKFSVASKQTVIVSIGPQGEGQPTVAIFPIDNWEEFCDKLKKGSESDKQLLSNLYYFACAEQQLEGPGRVRISEELLELAHITDKVIIKGDGHYMTLWNPEDLKNLRRERLNYHKNNFTDRDYQL